MRAYLVALGILIFLLISQAQAQTKLTAPAFNPEVLATYSQSDDFLAGLKSLKPKIQSMCANLLESQLRLQTYSESWKLYSLYEMLEKEALMTGALQRVPTVIEVASVIPKYTNYRLVNEPITVLSKIKSGTILFADKGLQCGPDALSVTKGAYFLKCGDYLIGSGLIKADKLDLKKCLRVQALQNKTI